MKRICVISKSDTRGGGASAFAEQLANEYGAMGLEVAHYHLDSENLHPYGSRRGVVHYSKNLAGRLGYRDHFPLELLSSRIRGLPRKFDYLHLHDMSTVLSAATIKWLARRMPTVWTLHDLSAFTAGCIYPSGCEAYKTTCHNCPALGSWPLSTRFDRTPMLHKARKSLRQEPVFFSAPSRWMLGKFTEAGGPAKQVRFISNCVKTDVFQPTDQSTLRERYGLGDVKGPVIAFSAGWLADTRKGPFEVAQTLCRLKHLDPKLVLMGRWSDDAAHLFNGLDVTHLGFIKGEAERAEFFAMADATLLYSKEENAPLTAIESLSVGTPVFGFAAGGIPEIVINGQTGYVSERFSVTEVADQIEAMRPWNNPIVRAQCRQRAELIYQYRGVAQQFIKYFENIAASKLEEK